jgi:hypothetical protein
MHNFLKKIAMKKSTLAPKERTSYPLLWTSPSSNKIKHNRRIVDSNNRKFEQTIIFYFDNWLNEVTYISSPISIKENSNYQHLIELKSKNVVRVLINHISKNNINGPWYYLLNDLTEENPVNWKHSGQVKEIKKDWLNWAKENNYIS